MDYVLDNNLRLALLIFILIISAFLPNSRTLAGDKNENTINYKVTVADSAQNTPLELVNVLLKKGSSVVRIGETNKFGVTVLKDVVTGTYTLVTNYIGYKEFSAPVKINPNNNSIKILLQESAIGLGEVVVTGQKESHISNYLDIKTGFKTFETETFNAAPSLRMTSVVQENLTGAVRAPTGEVHIRGQHGEYTYFIDGIPIPLGVFGGLNEVVDSKVIKDITFYTGGFPAEFGGQIASVINIQNRVPPNGFQLDLSTYAGSYLTSNKGDLGTQVGNFKTINSNGQSLSLSNNTGSFGYFLSGTRQENDRRIDQPVPELFNDHGFDYFLYGKFDYLLGNNDYLTANLNYSVTQTQIPFDPAEGINFDNHNSYNSYQTLSYYHTISSDVDKASDLFAGLFVREGGLKFNTSPYDQTKQFFGNDTTTGYTIDQDRSFVTYGTRVKYSDELSHQLSYAAGFDLSATAGKGNFHFRDSAGNGPVDYNNYKGSDFGLFVQTEIHPFEWTRLEAGLRYDQHIAPAILLQKQVSPRLKISFFPDELNTIYLSYDKLFMPTNIEALSSIASTVGDTASPTFPEKDDLYEAGIMHNFFFGFTVKLDYFYKNSTPGLDDQSLGSSAIRVNINIDRVIVRGLELSLTYNDPSSPLTGFLNGAVIHAFGTGPVSGGFIPADYSTTPFDLDHDQRLSVVAGMNYQPKNWFLNLTGIYGSGLTNGNGDYQFKTGLFDFNTGAHTAPSWILNLSGGYIFAISDGNTIEPSIYITNLLDHHHLIKGAFFSGASFEEPRNVTFNIKYHL
jgi:outer membrane receptor protein involved in Fe transport